MMEKRGNSCFDFGNNTNLVKSKRSQVTIFIIIAIVIAAVLIIIFYPRLKLIASPSTPTSFVQDCIAKEIDPVMQKLESQGGSLKPGNAISYNGNSVEYLCYTNEYYKTCIMQQPLLKQHVEQELLSVIKDKANSCLADFKANYEGKGYSVSIDSGDVSVEIVPHSIKVIVNKKVTLTKGSNEVFDKFIVAKSSEIYDILLISQTILNYEARYGDSAPEEFMLYYPDLKIEKLKQADGSKIYIVTNKQSKEVFTFATRSLSWPEGYGVAQYA